MFIFAKNEVGRLNPYDRGQFANLLTMLTRCCFICNASWNGNTFMSMYVQIFFHSMERSFGRHRVNQSPATSRLDIKIDPSLSKDYKSRTQDLDLPPFTLNYDVSIRVKYPRTGCKSTTQSINHRMNDVTCTLYKNIDYILYY